MTSYQHSFDNSFSDSLRRKRDETTDGYLKSVLDVYLDDAREFNKNNPSSDDTDYSKASYDQVIKQSVLKRHGIEGTWDPETQSYGEDTENQLYAQMKYNPAATPENFKEAFGTCDESGCYWGDEVDSDDYYTVGKGGGTAHAKRGQAANRAKAAANRAKKKSAGGHPGGTGSTRGSTRGSTGGE
tara:strand:+ start:1705 stop:2259 length:555 start_codon:yes stop_codon:yes gene_type:complete